MNKKNLARRWFMKACWYDRTGSSRDKAIDAYRKSIQYDDRFTDTHVNLGFIYLAGKDYEKAIGYGCSRS